MQMTGILIVAQVVQASPHPLLVNKLTVRNPLIGPATAAKNEKEILKRHNTLPQTGFGMRIQLDPGKQCHQISIKSHGICLTPFCEIHTDQTLHPISGLQNIILQHLTLTDRMKVTGIVEQIPITHIISTLQQMPEIYSQFQI